jgi:hypothetical protein
LIEEQNQSLEPQLMISWNCDELIRHSWVQLATLLDQDPKGTVFYYARKEYLKCRFPDCPDLENRGLVSIQRPAAIALHSELVRFEFFDADGSFSGPPGSLRELDTRFACVRTTSCSTPSVDFQSLVSPKLAGFKIVFDEETWISGIVSDVRADGRMDLTGAQGRWLNCPVSFDPELVLQLRIVHPSPEAVEVLESAGCLYDSDLGSLFDE